MKPKHAIITRVLASSARQRGSALSGFTLIEVVLAIVIALGILVVLLYFYQQATNLRAQAIQETERIAAARLLMDRITGELRAAVPAPSSGSALLGGSNFIQFVRADLPPFNAWTGGPLGRSPVPVTDLKLMRYRLETQEGSNVAGLFRSEQPLTLAQSTADSTVLNVSEAAMTNNLADVAGVETTNNLAAPKNAVPVVEEIKFLQFRYWSGTNWLDTWSGPSLPNGVEVSLGPEAATNDAASVDFPAEVFRRVIYLPTKAFALNTSTKTNAEPSELTGSREGVP